METKVDYPDNELLTPKQIALLANKSLPTIYNWLDVSKPENPVIKGSRVSYRASDVKVWLDIKFAKKRHREANKHAYRTTRRIAKAVYRLRETDNPRYLSILALLNGRDE